MGWVKTMGFVTSDFLVGWVGTDFFLPKIDAKSLESLIIGCSLFYSNQSMTDDSIIFYLQWATVKE